jgi:hypothetical protein
MPFCNKAKNTTRNRRRCAWSALGTLRRQVGLVPGQETDGALGPLLLGHA